ncbi:MAG: hypothetical protein WC867_01065 [Candidatus Pacearchaeota archaeon]|jgi:hypothetical protein
MQNKPHGSTDCTFYRNGDLIELQYEHRGINREDDAYFLLNISVKSLTEAVESLKENNKKERYNIGINEEITFVPKGYIKDPDFTASIWANAREIKLGAKCLDKLLKNADSSLVLKKTYHPHKRIE